MDKSNIGLETLHTTTTTVSTQLVNSTHIALSTKSEQINLEKELDLINELTKILKQTKALGIAANQIGEAKNLFLIATKNRHKNLLNNILVLGNSEIIEYSDEKCFFDEGCLSFPDVFLHIRRPASITIKYQTILNNNIHDQEKTYFGLSARVIQHEFDHVQGRVFFSRMF